MLQTKNRDRVVGVLALALAVGCQTNNLGSNPTGPSTNTGGSTGGGGTGGGGTDAAGNNFGFAVEDPGFPPGQLPRTYPLNAGTNALFYAAAQMQTWTATWTNGATGSVTVTNRTASGASGTFNFVLVPSGGGATGNKTVTGSFNVTF